MYPREYPCRIAGKQNPVVARLFELRHLIQQTTPVSWILTRCFWMSAELKGQYFHTAILRKAAPIQNLGRFSVTPGNPSSQTEKL